MCPSLAASSAPRCAPRGRFLTGKHPRSALESSGGWARQPGWNNSSLGHPNCSKTKEDARKFTLQQHEMSDVESSGRALCHLPLSWGTESPYDLWPLVLWEASPGLGREPSPHFHFIPRIHHSQPPCRAQQTASRRKAVLTAASPSPFRPKMGEALGFNLPNPLLKGSRQEFFP